MSSDFVFASIAVLWLLQAVRVLVWLYRTRERVRGFPQSVRRNLTRLRAKDWPEDLSPDDRRFVETYRRRFMIQYYALLAFPMCVVAAGIFLYALVGFLTHDY